MSKLTKLQDLMEKGNAPAYKSDHVGISFEGTDHALAWKKFQDENIDKSKLFFELPTTTDAHGNVIEHPEETCGLEDHPHITLLYGLSGHKDQVAETAMASDYLNGKFGPINKFSNKDRGYDVIWISLKDHNLTPFVDSLQENTGVKSKFPTYTPHMTLAYVLPESHDHLLGQEPLEGMEFTCDRVSYKDNAETGGKISIPLNKVKVESNGRKSALDYFNSTSHYSRPKTAYFKIIKISGKEKMIIAYNIASDKLVDVATEKVAKAVSSDKKIQYEVMDYDGWNKLTNMVTYPEGEEPMVFDHNGNDQTPVDKSERLLQMCAEALDVIPHGILGSTLFVTINGRKYGYNAAPNAGKSIEEIEKTFIDMIKHGAGKALAWLKKVTVLASGSVKGLSKLDPSRHNQSLGGLK